MNTYVSNVPFRHSYQVRRIIPKFTRHDGSAHTTNGKFIPSAESCSYPIARNHNSRRNYSRCKPQGSAGELYVAKWSSRKPYHTWR
ncbi:hypothetical protein ATCV1_z337L [Acanthocystis turfacea chlorella virus 1]|uniref:Uncharacterized protein z337L n=1 Tax=Chlorovirus heliozoae TaxID=322019 RepID=A7K8U7_9PHYC|nr:hypothetical protein ATCV1_z337L [Acanthocystis turfacea chlorella virus 1]ABT16471.1 hypothetical protein ATCV1_z337L [Acanthocystis turfacea chlorella virus 1]